MQRRAYRRTYIREWREKRGLSLRQLAARLEESPGGAHVSHATLGRIETGKQAYTQPILEALAEALGVDVVHLLSMHPDREGEVVDITDQLRALDDSKQAQALEYLRFLATK